MGVSRLSQFLYTGATTRPEERGSLGEPILMKFVRSHVESPVRSRGIAAARVSRSGRDILGT
jgi:hypothetical protein